MQNPPEEVLNIWGVTPLAQVADTGHARIWKVATADRGYRALKLYLRPDRGNEAAGTRLLAVWRDRGAVRIFAETDNAVLMEWLDGPSLGDVARNGEPKRAISLLAETAQSLHREPQVAMSGLKPLHEVFGPLFSADFADHCPASLSKDIKRAVKLAKRLLETKDKQIPLHGDLHPDNVILTKSGPVIIDAKGYVGDPAFEMANAIRHPKGMPGLVRQPEQIRQSLSLYSEAMNVPTARLAQWAAAKCALSIFWRSKGLITDDHEADLLNYLLGIADQ